MPFFLSNKRCFTLQDFELCISKFSVILSNLEQHTCFQFNLFLNSHWKVYFYDPNSSINVIRCVMMLLNFS